MSSSYKSLEGAVGAEDPNRKRFLHFCFYGCFFFFFFFFHVCFKVVMGGVFSCCVCADHPTDSSFVTKTWVFFYDCSKGNFGNDWCCTRSWNFRDELNINPCMSIVEY